jgi:hypothetical protein
MVTTLREKPPWRVCCGGGLLAALIWITRRRFGSCWVARPRPAHGKQRPEHDGAQPGSPVQAGIDRLFAPIKVLTHEMAAGLTKIDYDSQVALVPPTMTAPRDPRPCAAREQQHAGNLPVARL